MRFQLGGGGGIVSAAILGFLLCSMTAAPAITTAATSTIAIMVPLFSGLVVFPVACAAM